FSSPAFWPRALLKSIGAISILELPADQLNLFHLARDSLILAGLGRLFGKQTGAVVDQCADERALADRDQIERAGKRRWHGLFLMAFEVLGLDPFPGSGNVESEFESIDVVQRIGADLLCRFDLDHHELVILKVELDGLHSLDLFKFELAEHLLL